MTSKAPVWGPYETVFAELEDSMAEFRGEVIVSETIVRGRRIINSLSTSEYDAVGFTDDEISIMRLTLRSTWLGLKRQRYDMKLPWSPYLRNF